MNELDSNSLLFLVSLLDTIIADIDYTILKTNDVDYLTYLEYSKKHLSLTYQRLISYCTQKNFM